MTARLTTFAMLIFLFLISYNFAFAGQLLPVTYITFEEEDTSTSVTINYQSEGNSSSTLVQYDIVSCQMLGCDYSFQQNGGQQKIATIDKTYHAVKIDNLQANTVYYFVVGDDETGYSQEFKFRTLPDDDTPLLLLNGGDMGTSRSISSIAEEAMSEEPHALLIGGDIAYANGKISNVGNWDAWFEIMMDTWITPKGFLVPIIVAIGNHEVSTGIALPGAKSPFYDVLFPQSTKTYFRRKLGSNAMLFVLDSGHRTKHGGDQADWLENNLKASQHFKHRLAMYHIPLYPSHRSYNGTFSKWGRKHWLPLFDKYKLTAALEHHDHTVKRSKILKANKEASKGTLYVGDGCFGRGPRKADPHRNYLAMAKSEKHLWSIYIESGHLNFRASGEGGKEFDHFNLFNSSRRTTVQEL